MHVYSKQIFFDIIYRYCDCWNHRKPNSHRTQYSDRLAFSFKVCVPDNIRSLKTDLGLNFDYRKTATKDGKKKRFSVTSKIFRYFLSLIQIKNRPENSIQFSNAQTHLPQVAVQAQAHRRLISTRLH